ncbi:uncharacterized protein HMPREF1541_03050 [Cyphellophora europaea CBS 101466]|uniref:Carboxylic ester hydrolase n=1 Tax=Cyphellophora europaea (strain CBS 101466) TaxID=1220924 RepID=W2RXR5_CYPE1|nr:uncharacterized protein HMPREF1541_03050 [Cyphellophora europaea CBS 101466]ETN41115.1 hypothetical protein HMPREF1541_03050 [Cyphellophora europaea CBS 101466]
MLLTVGSLVLSLITSAAAHPIYDSSFSNTLERRQDSNASSVQVDLGYAVYEGFLNSSTNLNTFLGIRFAAPPTGALRWQKPQAPAQNRSAVIQANEYAPTCYQSPDASTMVHPANQSLAAEDCLFLNVWAPVSSDTLTNSTGTGLPVFVWIHGGGYGAGSNRQDLSSLINTNKNSFIGVAVAYRLGAFGFLSSAELASQGATPNAGLYDQHFALEWVQRNIARFGGDPSRVTIGGESAGGGSVMLQDTAFGGSQGIALFRNTFAASPYLPMQHDYNGWVPTQSFYALAAVVGCSAAISEPYGRVGGQTVLACLQGVDEETLANASATVSQSGTYGTWAFLPVTDGALVPGLPSQQLLRRKINGLNALVGNNANEGPGFTPQNITTEEGLVAWLNRTFPLFAPSDIAKILLYYPSPDDDTVGSEFSTSGYEGPTAVNQSYVGTGQQQRANNIYAETTFVCPSYWMAEAYTPSGATDRKGYKYQYSVPPALHGSDTVAYFSPPDTANVGEDMGVAFKTILGSFVVSDNPSIALDVAFGAASATATGANATTAAAGPGPAGQVGAGSAAIADWPPFSLSQPWQIDLNQTGGTPTQVPFGMVNITEFFPPGTRNSIGLYDAWTWEGGRGVRCDFWRSMAALVPE